MSLLFNVVYATRCSSTHHKIALDALRQLRGPAAPRWHDLFLKHHEAYLRGAKAPDTTFKDFTNHVLHVGEGEWGGAAAEARRWYGRCVASLRAADWPHATYQAGVLSHYYADPLQPFHTGQTEEEGKLHRPAEWSITKSYEELRRMLIEELGGYPEVEVPDRSDWLETMVRQGARQSHPHYELLVDHYDFAAGIKRPPAGLDEALRQCLARLLGHAVAGMSRILEQAFEESEAHPPTVSLALESVVATLGVPVAWVARKLDDARERAALADLAYEVQKTGKAVYTLPEDDWTVRQRHAAEVLKVPQAELDARPIRPTGTRHGRPAESAAAERRPRPEDSLRQRLASRDGGDARREPPPADEPSPAPRRARELRDLRALTLPGAAQRPPQAPPRPEPEPEPAAAPPRPVSAEPDADRADQPFWNPAAPEVPAAEPSRREAPGEPAEPAGSRFFLELESPIVDAPGIGSKTADRLQAVGVHRVVDLLRADPRALAGRIGQRWITPELVERWQDQAELVRRIPGLRGHDAQLLAAAELTDPEDIATLAPERILARLEPVVQSQEGQRILRSARPPDLNEVAQWVAAAAECRGAFTEH